MENKRNVYKPFDQKQFSTQIAANATNDGASKASKSWNGAGVGGSTVIVVV